MILPRHICEQHKPMRKLLNELQRSDKRLRSCLDRRSLANKKALKYLCAVIADRELFMLNIDICSKQCGFCSRFAEDLNHYRSAHWGEWYKRVSLPSSVAEHLSQSQEVVGASPAGG